VNAFKNIRHGAAVTVCIAAMSIGLSAAAQASTAHVATATYPAYQTGTVHSCTLNLYGSVYSNDGGQTWYFSGSTGSNTTAYQFGVVHSNKTGLHANVVTHNYGYSWQYAPNSGPAPCSIP
jgi:hypothetical protein